MIYSTMELLETAKGIMNDEKLAEKIGIQRASISAARKRGHVGAYTATKLAKLAGINEIFAVALAGAEAEKDKQGRAYLISTLRGAFGEVEMMKERTQNRKKEVEARQQISVYYVKLCEYFACCIFAIVEAIFTIVTYFNVKKGQVVGQS